MHSKELVRILMWVGAVFLVYYAVLGATGGAGRSICIGVGC